MLACRHIASLLIVVDAAQVGSRITCMHCACALAFEVSDVLDLMMASVALCMHVCAATVSLDAVLTT